MEPQTATPSINETPTSPPKKARPKKNEQVVAPPPQSPPPVQGTPLNEPPQAGPLMTPGKIPAEPAQTLQPTIVTPVAPLPAPLPASTENQIDLRKILAPFAKIPHEPTMKPEQVLYRITRNATTADITNGQLIAAKKALGMI